MNKQERGGFKLLTDIIAERFLKKLGTESFNERISIVEKYKKQWELSEIEFKSEFSTNSLIFYAVSKRYGKVTHTSHTDIC